MSNMFYVDWPNHIHLNALSDLLKYFKLSIDGQWLINKSLANKIYYCMHGQKLYFSSQIRPLLTILDHAEMDDEIGFYYKNTGFIVPPFTLYKGVFRIAAYSKFCVHNEEIAYENIFPISGKEKIDLEKFEEILLTSIPLPLGKRMILTLSGGADSSLLAALCCNKKVDRASLDTVTCVMDGFEPEARRAVKIAETCGFSHILYKPDQSSIEKIAKQFVQETYEPVFDSVMPVLTDMVDASKYNILLDGQAADSLLMGLPHNRLLDLYHPLFILLYPLTWSLEKFPFSKSNKILRIVYRISKVLKSLASPNPFVCLLKSLNFPYEPQSKYYKHVVNELDNINKYYCNLQKTISYFFMFRIVAIREMQKYEILARRGMDIALPFTSQALIDYCFRLDTNELFDGQKIKKPIYQILDKYLPGMIPQNQTSPFFVKVNCDYATSKKNALFGKNYPIHDWDCFTNASKWLNFIGIQLNTGKTRLHDDGK